ncbi:hypothetical protein ACFLWD_01470 [Chloroflexota bacterium]
MSSIKAQKSIRSAIKWLLLAIVIFYLITGFGITEFRTVESLTLGLLTKSLAFKLHEILWIPFVILLVLHIFLSPILRLWKKK